MLIIMTSNFELSTIGFLLVYHTDYNKIRLYLELLRAIGFKDGQELAHRVSICLKR